MVLKPMPRGGACWVQCQTCETSGKNGSHLDKTGLREDSLPTRSPLMFQQLNLSRSDSGIRGEIDSETTDGGHLGVPPSDIISQPSALEMPCFCDIYGGIQLQDEI